MDVDPISPTNRMTHHPAVDLDDEDTDIAGPGGLMIAWGGLIITIIGVTIQTIWWSTRLPLNVASHFDIAGQVDGTMSRSSLIASQIALQAFWTIGVLLLIWATNRQPHRWLNIPHREHWLDDSRRERTLRLWNTISLRMAIVSMWFFAGLFQLVAAFNVGWRPTLSPAVYLLAAGYLIAILALFSRLYLYFKRPAV